MMSQSVPTSSRRDIDMRTMLSGSEPIRFDPTSAKRAVTVHERATKSDMVSPRKDKGLVL